MIRGGGSVAISTGAIGNVVEICLKISRVGLKVSKSGVSRLNYVAIGEKSIKGEQRQRQEVPSAPCERLTTSSL